MFLKCIKEWDPNIYDMETVLSKATSHLNLIRNSSEMVQALAELRRMNEEYDKALEFYLQLIGQILNDIPEHFEIETILKNNPARKNYTLVAIIQMDKDIQAKKTRNNNDTIGELNDDDDEKKENIAKKKKKTLEELNAIQTRVFNMINEYNLYQNHVQDKILSLIELDCARSVELFTEHRDYIPPSSIVKEIQIKLKDLEIPSRQRSMRNFNDKSARSSRVIGGRTKLHKKTQFVGKYKRYLKIFLVCKHFIIIITIIIIV